MPGIVGLITRLPRQRAEAEMQRMARSLLHEPAYLSGTWSDEALGLYVGWTALRGSFAREMPVCDERRDRTLIFSGEDFAGAGGRRRGKEQGRAVEDDGPSYLARLAEGAEFPRMLNGWFHGVLAERAEARAILFNDRYGAHRLYYHEAPDAFYFAAEAKAILAVRPELRSIDPVGLGEFISCGCALENRTLFRGIRLLPPASAWTIRNGKVEGRARYFDPREWEEQSPLAGEDYYRQLRDVFSENLGRYFRGDERIGVSLTGGLDTRMIMAWRKAAPGSLPCYSFGGIYRESQDVKIARKVARQCGQTHETIPLGGEFLARFPRYAERTVFLADGCVEVRYAPDLYLNELAAKIAPVRITGNYGGEVLRGVQAFRPIDPVPELFDADVSVYIERAKDTYNRLLPVHPLSFAAFRQTPWHHCGLLSLEQSQLTLRSPFLDNDFVRTVYRAPASTLASDDISLRLIAEGNPALLRIGTDHGLGGRLPGWLATLRRDYLEFTFKAEYAYDYGMPQTVARIDHALHWAHLERLFLGRHKFDHFRVWYRDVLADYVREMLLDSRTLSRPYLQRKTVEEIVRGHLKGNRNYTMALHKVLSLEHLHRLFID